MTGQIEQEIIAALCRGSKGRLERVETQRIRREAAALHIVRVWRSERAQNALRSVGAPGLGDWRRDG